jgi:hypothetical protein
MDERLKSIISSLDGIRSVEDESELGRLEIALNDLSMAERSELATEALLRIFERYPDKDGFGIFWSILHLLESFPDYESALIESVRRRPSSFSLLMVNRILNTGRRYAGDVDLLALLEDSAHTAHAPETVRDEAREFIEWQRASQQS